MRETATYRTILLGARALPQHANGAASLRFPNEIESPARPSSHCPARARSGGPVSPRRAAHLASDTASPLPCSARRPSRNTKAASDGHASARDKREAVGIDPKYVSSRKAAKPASLPQSESTAALIAEFLARGGTIQQCPGVGQGPLPHYDQRFAGMTGRERKRAMIGIAVENARHARRFKRTRGC